MDKEVFIRPVYLVWLEVFPSCVDQRHKVTPFQHHEFMIRWRTREHDTSAELRQLALLPHYSSSVKYYLTHRTRGAAPRYVRRRSFTNHNYTKGDAKALRTYLFLFTIPLKRTFTFFSLFFFIATKFNPRFDTSNTAMYISANVNNR